jgi:signal transduction histidine kinase
MFDLNGHMRGNSVGPVPVKKARNRNGDQLTEPVSGCSSVLTELSREMRTQMNAIVAFSYMMNKREYSDPEKEEFSNHIYNSCEQIISLFDNFLDSAIIDTGNSNQEPGDFNPGVLFAELFSEFRETMKKERYKDLLLVSMNTDGNSPDYIFDANRVTRVIRNLFSIALNNTKSGYIKAAYSITDSRLVFCISDSGHGYQKCREFLQSSNMSESLSKYNDIHTAVNIALTRKLVRMMDGSVWIESNGITGSSVCCSIPVGVVSDHEKQLNKFSNTMSAT